MKSEDTRTIKIDFTNFKAMKELMKNHEKFNTSLIGENENHEPVFISINEDNVVKVTCQHNGWARKNILWSDGTIEELYER